MKYLVYCGRKPAPWTFVCDRFKKGVTFPDKQTPVAFSDEDAAWLIANNPIMFAQVEAPETKIISEPGLEPEIEIKSELEFEPVLTLDEMLTRDSNLKKRRGRPRVESAVYTDPASVLLRDGADE